MDELKPCPCCGGKAVIDVGRDEERFLAYVFCANYKVKDGYCQCEMKYWAESAEKARYDAVNAWNRRAIDDKVSDALNSAAGRWAHADSENRELRELIVCMYQTINGMKRKAANGDWLPCTDSCPYWGSGDCADLPDDECWFELRMRDLEIEVES